MIVLRTAPDAWTAGGAFWEVGVPEVSDRRRSDRPARQLYEGKRAQRVGW